MNHYQVGGSLSSDHPYYVRRQADIDLYQVLHQGQFCYVFNARQMGKSSLMVQVFHQLQRSGVYCAAIDLSRIGSATVTLEQWYKGFVVELWQAFDLGTTVNLKQWWEDRRDLAPVQRLGQFIEEILLVEVGRPERPKLVLFLDEVDSVRGLDFSLDDFFRLIRACYNRRSLKPEYGRLTFALFGVATPADLITDHQRTPFNIGRALDLNGFQATDAQPLAAGLVGFVRDPQVALPEIVKWTGGQPFLMQKVCQLVVEQAISPQLIRDDRAHIAQLIQRFIIQTWEFQDEPEHLRTIRDRLLSQPQFAGRRLGIYQQILETQAVAFDGSREQIELLLSGLVTNQQGQLGVKNAIYRAVFNADWVSQQLAQLRPYAQFLEAWIASGHGQPAYLLRGLALQEALAWTLGKSLGNQDYQFLAASQELAKQEAQTALAAVEQASQILATARQQANREVRQRRLGWWWIPGMTGCIMALMVLVRSLGLLQGLEWQGFDQFVSWRSREPLDQRIAIITIDEQDITQVGYPLPDRVLAQAITLIKAQQPRAIGLDLYRDLPVEPGHTELLSVFQSTPNLFGIEKVVGDDAAGAPVAPPPGLAAKDQVGFADQIEDADGKVRRALLSVQTEHEVRYSLALKLSLHYLAATGITEQALDQSGQRLQLGKAIFEKFAANDGGYVRARDGGYQVLINFRGPETSFLSIPLRQVLQGQVPPEQLRNRVVLMGNVLASVKDTFRTPYNSQWFDSGKLMHGVALHANIVSQIISAAVDDRSLLRVWSEPLEWLWIVVWTGVGAVMGWWWRSPFKLAISLLLASTGLVGSCYLAFGAGWWIPLVPALFGLWGAVIAIVMGINRQRDRLQFRRTLALLLAVQQDDPTAGRIAIEYLKQSEPKEHQVLIDQALA